MTVARRPAAVIIAILREAPNGIVFVERATHLRDHPGQIGLPGGGVDAVDSDLEHTALRELREEVGIAENRVHVVGALPLIRQRINTFDVTPFVAVVDPGELTIDPRETAAVFTVPLATILGPALQDGEVEFAGLQIASPVLDHDGRRIWGLTARILQSFVHAWNANGLRAQIERELR
ncbi:MAG: NUDIX hydrolase [Vulcanimicrobiaceae bacterium]